MKLKIRVIEGKSKYLLLGDKDLDSMILPVIMDISDLESILKKLAQFVTPGVDIKISTNMDTAQIIIGVENANL